MRYNGLKTTGSFFIAGLAGGLAITVLKFGNDGFSFATPIYYAVSGGMGGVIWVLCRRFLNISGSLFLFLIACMASGIATGLTLLQFGYSMTTFTPDADDRDYFSVSVACAIGSLVYGLIHCYQTHDKPEVSNGENLSGEERSP